MRQLLVVALVLATVRGEASDDPEILVIRTPPKAGGVPEAHIEWMRDTVLPQLERELQLSHSVTVTYRSCGKANGYYDAATHTITICHELWDDRVAMYAAAGHGDIDHAMAYTVFHELGHAMHHQLDLPLVGSIEDDVDEIATMWLIELGLLDVAKFAASGHYLETASGRDHDFWDEHGSGAQRGFAIACLLYGAGVDATDEMHVPASRLKKCLSDYPRRLATWRKLFGRT